jgi:hypothetical protein
VSTDGTTWTMATLPAGTTPLHGLIAGPTLVALGESGLVYASTNNGASWTALKPLGGAIGTCNAGAYGKNASGQTFYVAVCDNGYMAKSPNGSTNWESGPVVVVNGAGVNLHGIAWTGSQFVAVGDNGAITTSADGVKWSLLKTSAVSGPLRSVAVSSSGTIVVVGDNGIETSNDGSNWTAQTEGAAVAMMGATYGNGEFVAVGSGGAVKTAPN